MGIDHTPVLLFGSTEDIFDKLPQKLQNIYGMEGDDEVDDFSRYFDGRTLEPEAEEYLGTQLYEEFKDIDIWINPMDGSFEGLGVELDPKNRSINLRVRKKVEDVFKKYNLGKPEVNNFVHTW